MTAPSIPPVGWTGTPEQKEALRKAGILPEAPLSEKVSTWWHTLPLGFQIVTASVGATGLFLVTAQVFTVLGRRR